MDEKKEPTLLQQRKKDLFFSCLLYTSGAHGLRHWGAVRHDRGGDEGGD